MYIPTINLNRKRLDLTRFSDSTESTTKLDIGRESVLVDKGRYQKLVGKLIYLSHTRPNISFSISMVSQFINDPKEEQMEAVYHILRYLKLTLGKGLMFRKTTNRDVEIYSDTDWAGSIQDRRSTFRYCSYMWEKSCYMV